MSHLTPLLVSVELEFGLKGKDSWESLKAAIEGSVSASNEDVTSILLRDNLRMKQIIGAVSALTSSVDSSVSIKSEAENFSAATFIEGLERQPIGAIPLKG